MDFPLNKGFSGILSTPGFTGLLIKIPILNNSGNI